MTRGKTPVHDEAKIKHGRSTNRGRSSLHERESRTHGRYLYASDISAPVSRLRVSGDGGGEVRRHRSVRCSWGIHCGHLADEP